MNKTILLKGMLLCLLVLSCNRSVAKSSGAEEIPVYHTWQSLREMDYGEPVPPPLGEIPQPGAFPWIGIASHHLLAHEYLDSWFSLLAEMRKPKCFYILSPAHYGVSLEPYSLTIGSWESSFGKVESDRAKVYRLAELLEVGLDPRAFEVEHGVSTLMPYIKKYFPDAKVVAVAHEGDPPVNTLLSRRLADALESEFDEKGKQENFLLISTDFSHHANIKETARRDNSSRQYLENPNDISWNMAVCDNRPAVYVLNRLGKNNLESYILYHTSSREISNQGEDDITSYFFVFFADKIAADSLE
ncbi:MAG: AmmeMemoRadiSam system protein B [Treponema sp.]|nr:AmmeMemoRadiSam system protein B [Treponema sp.]